MKILLALQCAHALVFLVPTERSTVIVQSGVSSYTGNQHGGKYNFGQSQDAQAAAGADYSRSVQQKDTEVSPELFKVLKEAIAESSEVRVLEFDDAGIAFAPIENLGPTWLQYAAAIVGPGADSFALEAPGSGSLPPRKESTLRISRREKESDAAKLVIVSDDRDTWVWNL